MGRISLRRLTVQNFRSFEGSHTLEFDSNGLYLVRGVNLDSRGESGSGKSSLFHAIAYALDFAPYSAADLHCWFNEEPMFVELELDTEKGPAVLHRGDKLWLKYDGHKITSAKAVGEKLDEICGMNKKLREAITYRRQRTFGLFLSKRDSEKKAFLVELLGLHWLEEAIESAVERVSAAKKVVDSFRPTLELHQQLEAEAASRVPKAIQLDSTAIEAELNLAQASVDSHKDIRDRIQHDLNLCLAEERKAIVPFVHDNTAERSLSKAIDQCRVRISRLGQPELEISKHQREINRLHEEINRLFDDKCPRCERTWDQANAQMDANHARIQEIERPLAAATDRATTLGKLKEVESDIRRQIEVAQVAELEAERAHNLAMQKISSDPNRKSVEKRRQLDEVEVGLQLALSNGNRIAATLSNIKHQNDTNRRLRAQALDAVVSAMTKRKAAQRQLIEAEYIFNAERDYLDLLRGFLGQIFSEILTEISDETNRILANLPNASKVTLKFETDRLTQDDKVRNEITPVAMFGGRKWPLESGASGGMFTSVEIAVDLAVSNIIAARTGVDLGWLILDESFANGSDKITKEGCLEILKQYAEKKLIIVVEHASEFKELFSRIIEVELNNERSRIL